VVIIIPTPSVTPQGRLSVHGCVPTEAVGTVTDNELPGSNPFFFLSAQISSIRACALRRAGAFYAFDIFGLDPAAPA